MKIDNDIILIDFNTISLDELAAGLADLFQEAKMMKKILKNRMGDIIYYGVFAFLYVRLVFFGVDQLLLECCGT